MNRNAIVAGAVLLGLLAAGCSDHRIGLNEFLQMQQEMAKAPTTQPVDSGALTKLVDTQLGPYKVGPSDVLTVTLTGADQNAIFPSTQVRVDREGGFPRVGRAFTSDAIGTLAGALLGTSTVTTYI